MARERCFWVVSPNVRYDYRQVPEWKESILRLRCAFMGYGSEDKQHKEIGYNFAHKIMAGDVILVARSRANEPDVLAMGVVAGKFQKYRKGLNTPREFGSLRKLRCFKRVTNIPNGIPIMSALGHRTALRQLHPTWNEDHQKVCAWMSQQLSIDAPSASHYESAETLLRALSPANKTEYTVQGRAGLLKADKAEARLLLAYQEWLKRQGRVLHLARYGKIVCDAYEKKTRNLIEAKRVAKREFIRMAAGQLLDYAFAGRKEIKNPNMAILLPNHPTEESLGWLKEIGIHLVWKDGKTFRDNCGGRFT